MAYGVLLTGATGAIGPTLASELLDQGAGHTLRILVRPSIRGGDRFSGWLGSVADVARADGRHVDFSRVSAIHADLRVDGLGLSRAQTDELTRDTQVIIHAAADTGFRSPPEDQWNTNVNGLRRILELSAQCRRLRKVIVVSTVCVSGTMTGRVRECLCSEMPGFVNHYERTKWEAERLAAASRLPVEIVRLSIVSGSHATGAVHRMGALHHVLRWFGRGLIPRVPGTPLTGVDLIATETAAAFLARAVMTPTDPGLVCHVAAGEQAVPLADLMSFTWQQARSTGPAATTDDPSRPQLVDGDAFRRFCDALDPVRQRILQQSMESVQTCLPILLYPRVYETARAQRLWGGPLPLYDWRQTLARVLRMSHPQPRPVAPGADAA